MTYQKTARGSDRASGRRFIDVAFFGGSWLSLF